MNVKKTLSLILIACLIWNLSLSAEGFSVKLRGKLALVGILSGVAYLTHVLVKRDKQVAETIQSQLGTLENIIKIERGFNQWNVHYYGGHSYFFLNNRFIRKKGNKAFFLNQISPGFTGQGLSTYDTSNLIGSFSPFFTDTSVSVNPRWLSLYPSHQQIVLPPAIPYLHPLEDERLSVLQQLHLHLR